jgi:hypothetical protein
MSLVVPRMRPSSSVYGIFTAEEFDDKADYLAARWFGTGGAVGHSHSIRSPTR